MDFPDSSVSSVVISAWVTASKVVRVDWENWLYSLGCELSCVIWLYSAYHSSISSFCAGLSSAYVPWNSFGAVGAVFCALSVAANKSANVPVNCLNISFSGDRLIKPEPAVLQCCLHSAGKINVPGFPGLLLRNRPNVRLAGSSE